MLTQSINAWLTSPDEYQTGLELLKQSGFTGFVLTILSKGDDTYNRGRLETELRKWVDGQKNVLPIDSAATRFSKDNSVSVIPKIPANTDVKPTEIPRKLTSTGEPDAVQAIRKQIYSLMDLRAEAKAALRAMEHLGNDETACEARKPYAYQIKAVTRQIDELYSQLDFFNQHGYLPSTDPAVIVDDTAALMNARSYVSRYKAKLKKKNLTPEQRQSAESLLKQYTDEKNRLETKLSKTQTNDSHSTGQQTTDRPIHNPPLSGA